MQSSDTKEFKRRNEAARKGRARAGKRLHAIAVVLLSKS